MMKSNASFKVCNSVCQHSSGCGIVSGAEGCISRVADLNGVSPLYIMLEIHHSGQEPSILKACLVLEAITDVQFCSSSGCFCFRMRNRVFLLLSFWLCLLLHILSSVCRWKMQNLSCSSYKTVGIGQMYVSCCCCKPDLWLWKSCKFSEACDL